MTRDSPFELRARELATAAGLDPDSRVPRPGDAPGDRGWPAWCGFRDAAKAEHRAREAASVVHADPDATHDVPFTVFGEHDPATLEQMRACMRTGRAVAGVICADGHLGYAQPVGGVIAYDGQVSISGVGFDIGCFTGDTRIFTLDGQTPTLAEREGQSVWVLACDAKGKPVPAQGLCTRTRRDAPLVRVTLDSGRSLRCTPDHLFMLRDGTYQRADALAQGQSLMPLYMTADKDGYVMVRNNQTQRLMRLHWMVYRAGLTTPAPDLAGDELVLHHCNFAREDNEPSNLQPMRKVEHDAMHAQMRDRAHFNTPEYQERRIAAIKEFWVGARQDDAFMKRRRETATINITNYMNDRPEHFREAVKDNGRRGAAHLRRFNTDPETIRRNRERARVPRPCPLCGAVMVATSSLYYHARKEHPEALEAGREAKLQRGMNSVAERLLVGANNHKVVSVEAIPEKEDVFCLSVPGLNNFALADGVFVHNCGNMAVRLDVPYAAIRDQARTILADIRRHVSFGIGQANAERIQHPVLDDDDAWRASGMEDYRQKARKQLGTVGGGNHYVDLFRDEEERVWIGVHFGSRGLGHTTATCYLKRAGGKEGMNVPPAVVTEDGELGRAYLAAMELAGRYAEAGRECVVERVRQIIGGTVTHTVHNHHNYAWRETHGGRDLRVVRKGATPAFPGQQGFVGGSMCDDAVILEGVASPEAESALYSTVHGAGRLFSRTEARRRSTWVELESWLQGRGVLLAGGDLDESPMAYRRLPDVLAHHAATVRVLHRLRPFAVAMAGPSELDPFKD